MHKNRYYNIAVNEDDKSATIMLYEYIGDMRDWYTGEKIGVTDSDFKKELDRLAAKFDTIHVRINSLGGEVFHGAAIVNAIRECRAEVHTWNDGVAASMAGIIWMAGAKRHMAKNALLMLHSASNYFWGNAKQMRKAADDLDTFDEALILSASASVGMDPDEMKNKYFNYEDHWLSYKSVEAEGWVTEKDDYSSADPLPTNAAEQGYMALLKKYQGTKAQAQPQEKKPDWFEKAKAFFANIGANTSPTNTLKMNFDEFKTALQEGKLNIQEVKAHVEALQAPPEPPTPPATPPAPEPNPEFSKLQQELASLKEAVTALGQAPGAARSQPAKPDGDPPTGDGQPSAKAELEKANKELRAAAVAGEAVRFLPSSADGI